jgi:hypothetical protein
MKRRKIEMMKYFLIVAGILTMCVPDDAGWLQFVLQGVAGLAMFIVGVGMMLDSQDDL